MGGHGALGVPGRARGEDQVGQVADGRGTAVRPAATSGSHRAGLGQELVPTTVAGTAGPAGRAVPAPSRAQHHDPLEVGQRRRRRPPPRRAAPGSRCPRNPCDGEEEPGPRRPQDVGRLGPLVAGVERDEHRTGADRPEGGDDPLRAVRRPDGDPVAGLDPVGHRRPGWRWPPPRPAGRTTSRVVVPPGPLRSTSASASPKRAAASWTRPGRVPHSRSPRGSVTSDTPSG